MRRTLGVPLVTVAFLAVSPAHLAGQPVSVGAVFTGLVNGGESVAQRGCGASHSVGLGPALLWGDGRVRLALNARVYPMSLATCAADLVPPPANGTVTYEDDHSLKASRFATTDARMSFHPGRRLALGVGAGVAWHRGVDFPYGVVSAEVKPIVRPRWGLGVGLELYGLRVATDRTRVTYQNSVPVLTEDLGRERGWSHGIVLTVGFHIAAF